MGTFGSIIRGVEASAVGTLAMDAVLYRRYRNGGGGPHSPRGSRPRAWRPGKTHRRPRWSPSNSSSARSGGRSRRATRGSSTTSRTWGSDWPGAQDTGLIVGSRKPRVRYGPPFGAAVWVGGNVVLPRLGVYQEIWEYDVGTLEKDLSAHLVFGAATAAAFALLARASTGGAVLANQRRSR
jgi:hypothetical protein